jgi:Radical SAM superfamily/4Fe-4S single cluster domain
MPNTSTERLWHVTVLSNFIKGYDKYSRRYSKAGIPKSKYPDKFFLLRPEELGIGISKATLLLTKLNRPGDRLIALATSVPVGLLKDNLLTGIGRYIESQSILLDGVAQVEGEADAHRLGETSIEEVSAQSLRLNHANLHGYERLTPRSFSLLPIAKGCQAACPFCFSDASASADQEQAVMSISQVRDFARAARARGASRFVITGGGEPGLLRPAILSQIIATGNHELGKVILITNGHHLAKQQPGMLSETLKSYAHSGLSVLAVSRHHHDDEVSAKMMNLRTNVAEIAAAWRAGAAKWPTLKMRYTCVLQRGGIDTVKALAEYVDYAATQGIEEICFKELYVSTSVESVYHRHAANAWSLANQVPLSLVLEFAARSGFTETARLPWGAPVFSGSWRGHRMQFAAYTEPSLLWERANGIARSWNMMADGRCLVSLEDRNSEIRLPAAA